MKGKQTIKSLISKDVLKAIRRQVSRKHSERCYQEYILCFLGSWHVILLRNAHHETWVSTQIESYPCSALHASFLFYINVLTNSELPYDIKMTFSTWEKPSLSRFSHKQVISQ